MKQELQTIGKLKLSQTETTEAIKYWLEKEHKFDLTKAIYDIKGGTIQEVVIDVRKRDVSGERLRIPTNGVKILKTASIQVIRPMISTKVTPHLKKHEKVNKGLYGALREFFESERKRGIRVLNFEELYELVKVEYPHLEPSRLSLYLFDRRQFPDIDYKRIEGTVALLDKRKRK